MAIGERGDPYGRTRFHVEIGGLIVGGFSEVTGLGVTVASRTTDRTSSGGIRGIIDRLVAASDHHDSSRASTPRLRLTRGVTDDTELWGWMRATLDGEENSRTGRVILHDDAGEEAVVWELGGLEPVAYHGPDLLAAAPGVATETYELRYRTIERTVV